MAESDDTNQRCNDPEHSGPSKIKWPSSVQLNSSAAKRALFRAHGRCGAAPPSNAAGMPNWHGTQRWLAVFGPPRDVCQEITREFCLTGEFQVYFLPVLRAIYQRTVTGADCSTLCEDLKSPRHRKGKGWVTSSKQTRAHCARCIGTNTARGGGNLASPNGKETWLGYWKGSLDPHLWNSSRWTIIVLGMSVYLLEKKSSISF